MEIRVNPYFPFLKVRMHASASGTVKVRDTVFSNGCCIVKIGGNTLSRLGIASENVRFS